MAQVAKKNFSIYSDL